MKLLLGKFTIQAQYDGNYFQASGDNYRSWIGKLEVGDYVFPSNQGIIRNLLMCKEITDSGHDVVCTFDVVKTYNPNLLLTLNLVRSKYLALDINLLNKCYKSTNGTTFHELNILEPKPSPQDINFYETRNYYVVIEEYLETMKKNLKADDLVIIVDNSYDLNIKEISVFDGINFVQYKSLWNLYQEKVKADKKYPLSELLQFAKPEKDNAPKKLKYLENLIRRLKEESFMPIDKMVNFYDNVLVGRKKSGLIVGHQIESEEISSEETDDFSTAFAYQKYVDLMNFNPNIIIYGPPGTGKTYSLTRIIEAYELSLGNEVTFKQVEIENRVKFLTFHQAYSYEEFIEGLRPYTDENKNIKYDVKPGLLKSFIENNSLRNFPSSGKDKQLTDLGINAEKKVWRFSLGTKSEKHIYNYFKKQNQIAIGHGLNEDFNKLSEVQKNQANETLRRFVTDLQIGDVVCVFNDPQTIRLVGVVQSEYMFSNEGVNEYPHRREVIWISDFEKNPLNILSLNNGMTMSTGTLHRLHISVTNLFDKVGIIDKDIIRKPLYLVIDEINRGNISKIFGELITLIEKDKRDSLSVTLPYSQESFSIPSNLFIIGTMNTSDRSIALLDTALRRRFAFVELMPDLDLLESKNPTIGGLVSPAKLLEHINTKIAKLLDRDHVIGHSYFMNDPMSKEDLYYVWYYQILPLLMEYFYFDFRKLKDIVDDFVNPDQSTIVYFDTKAQQNGFSEFEEKLAKLYTQK